MPTPIVTCPDCGYGHIVAIPCPACGAEMTTNRFTLRTDEDATLARIDLLMEALIESVDYLTDEDTAILSDDAYAAYNAANVHFHGPTA